MPRAMSNVCRVCSHVVAVTLLVAADVIAQETTLQTLRQDVRQGLPQPPVASQPAPEKAADSDSEECPSAPQYGDGWSGEGVLAVAWLAGLAVTSPIWVPHAILEDDFQNSGHFYRYPYQNKSAYIVASEIPTQTKPWAARLDVEYVETFDRLDNLAGHLLIETAPRFGLDASANHLQERRPDGRYDSLQLGDCNLVYRFAQGTWGEFRTGLGLNWLRDDDATNLGFNFTYSADLYPRKPWVVSATIDCGTLGHAGLFRTRTTIGAMLHGVEAYTGYEYIDIGRTHCSGLIAGVRLWF